MNDVTLLRDKAAIVGIGQTEFSFDAGRGNLELAVQAIKAALDDCGLTVDDVDGLVRIDLEGLHELDIANTMGMKNIRSFGETPEGGCAAAGTVVDAAMRVATGQASVVVGWRALNSGSDRRSGPAPAPPARVGQFGDQYRVPFGLVSPGAIIAMSARRHMHEYGTTREHWAAVSLAFRRHANRNPNAIFYSRPLTLDDYMNARMICEPICLFDCCLQNDGAVAWVLTSAERAKDLPQSPAYILGGAQGYGFPQSPRMANYDRDTLTTGYESVNCGKTLYEVAGVGPNDIGVLQVYDHFVPWVVMAIEDFGFCEKGEGGPFVASGAIEFGTGRIPVNTSGGQLSEGYLHGTGLILEAVRQIRGTSTSQVEDVELSMVTSGNGAGTSALILRK